MFVFLFFFTGSDHFRQPVYCGADRIKVNDDDTSDRASLSKHVLNSALFMCETVETYLPRYKKISYKPSLPSVTIQKSIN